MASVEDLLTRYDRKTAEFLILSQIEANTLPDLEHDNIKPIFDDLVKRDLVRRDEDGDVAITKKAKAEMSTWFD